MTTHDEEMGLGARGRYGSSLGELGGKMHSVVMEEQEEGEGEDGSGGAGSSGPQEHAALDAGEEHAGLDLCDERMRPGLEELKNAKERWGVRQALRSRHPYSVQRVHGAGRPVALDGPVLRAELLYGASSL